MLVAVLKTDPGIVATTLTQPYEKASARAALASKYLFFRTPGRAVRGKPLPVGSLQIDAGDDDGLVVGADGVLRRVKGDATQAALMPPVRRRKTFDLVMDALGQKAVVFGFDPPLAAAPVIIPLPFATSGGANLPPSIVDGTLTALGCTIQVTRPKAIVALAALSGLTVSVASGTATEGVPGAKVRIVVEENS